MEGSASGRSDLEDREVRGPIVIGSGFGGGVAACRLAQAGLRPTVLERGRAYEPQDFPSIDLSDPDLSRWSWGLDGGLWDLRDLRGLHSVQAAGLGGGSLVYANVHLRPPPEALADWPEPHRRPALDPYFDLAAYMLDVQLPPTTSPKASAFSSAAQAEGHGAQVFVTPLAVRFEAAGDNRQGVPQKPCIGCGRCNVGCQEGAKNTLDLNYLAEARARGAEILTQHEVVLLQKDGASWLVEGRDHLLDVGFRLRAKSVFLCAGAVGTTELLLRSLPGLGEDAPRTIGERFFPNADALGMIYDTRSSFRSTEGPTITRGLLHAPEGHAGEPWLMVQEGGWPAELAPLFGLFRSELLAGSNRRTRGSAPDVAPGGATQAQRLMEGVVDAWLALALSPALSFAGSVDGPAAPSDPRSERSERSSALAEVEERIGDIAWIEDTSFPEGYLPAQARAALLGAAGAAAREVGRLASYIGDRALEATLARRPQLRWLGLDVPRLKTLLRWAGLDLDAVTEGGAVLETLGELGKRDAPGALLGPTPGERASMVLAMGRDGRPRTLRLGEDDRVIASETRAADRRTYRSGERILRDLARGAGGELRLNPSWVSRRVPVTVHAQGGVSMGDDNHRPLTPDGELRGCPDLFVLDAAAFPCPVGTNPSATICAVAERNVEAFIRRARPGWSAPERATAARWAKAAGEAVLDPLRALPAPSPPPRSGPLRLRFSERLVGFHASGVPGEGRRRAAEERGRREGRAIGIRLELTSSDLDALLAKETRALDARGRLAWTGPGGAEPRDAAVSGTLELFPDGDAPVPPRSLVYRLELEGVNGHFIGHKLLHDDPGFDAWEDATAVFFDLEVEGERSAGVVRVGFADFFGRQVPSMVVDAEGGGVDDGVASWALGAFGRLFFGGILGVYGGLSGRTGETVRSITASDGEDR